MTAGGVSKRREKGKRTLVRAGFSDRRKVEQEPLIHDHREAARAGGHFILRPAADCGQASKHFHRRIINAQASCGVRECFHVRHKTVEAEETGKIFGLNRSALEVGSDEELVG